MLRVILFRHGDAGDKKFFALTGQPDSQRPLTPKGKKDVAKMSKALAQIVPEIDLMASSNLVRAKETQSILARHFPEARSVLIPHLKPDAKPEKVLMWLRGLGRARNVILVGHEPHLSQFLSFVLTGKTDSIFDIKKGGLAVFDFVNQIAPQHARLKCLLQPSQVKKIRKS